MGLLPDLGAELELTTYPDGKAYEKQGGNAKLWTPPASISSATISAGDAQTLVDHSVALLNETDATARLVGVKTYFAADAPFDDPDGVFTGTSGSITRSQAFRRKTKDGDS